MEGTQLYANLLGIKIPWKVDRVQVDMASNRIDVWVEEAPGTMFSCAVCKQEAPVYYHPEEQVWRHLQDHNILGAPTLNPEAAF
jgi:transposase